MLRTLFLLVCLAGMLAVRAQSVQEDQLGAWYMYFYTTQPGEGGFGFQGDAQLRYWNLGGDLEQLLLRNGLTYQLKESKVKFTLGYAYVASGVPGDSRDRSEEHRIYQEALLPQRLGARVYLTHRFRYEQRFVEQQDFRTRYRYNLFINVVLNRTELIKGNTYLALYNEVFINGQTDIGDGRTVERFDRMRTYLGLGYGLSDRLRMQLGWMNQTTAVWSKGQLQVSTHYSW